MQTSQNKKVYSKQHEARIKGAAEPEYQKAKLWGKITRQTRLWLWDEKTRL